MRQHPLSGAFPAMPDVELAALAEDIRTNGLREPGVIFEGKILDGWHRYQACEQAEVIFKSFPLPAGRDPVALVHSRNLHRRHLTASQRAAAVVACSEWRPHGDQKSRVAPGATRTISEMAKVADVGERTIRHAKEAHAAGLGDAVKDGMLSAKQAAEVAKPSKPKLAKASPLEAENGRLKEENESLRENLPELTAMASAAEVFKNDEQFKKIMHLEVELASVKKRRDELMRENSELKKQIKHWKTKAEKAK